jgi:hypothetical protein
MQLLLGEAGLEGSGNATTLAHEKPDIPLSTLKNKADLYIEVGKV